MTKTCTRCHQEKDLTSFNKTAASKDGHAWHCRQCNSAAGAKRRELTPWKAAEASLRKAYGIGLEQKFQMYLNQNGKCSICANLFESLSAAYVDHSHKTGAVRDLLCIRCNFAVGLVKENFDVALKLAKYVQHHTGAI